MEQLQAKEMELLQLKTEIDISQGTKSLDGVTGFLYNLPVSVYYCMQYTHIWDILFYCNSAPLTLTLLHYFYCHYRVKKTIS